MICSEESYIQDLPALKVLIFSEYSDSYLAVAIGLKLRQREMLHVLFKSNYNKLKNYINNT